MSNQSLCSTTSVDAQPCANPNYFAEADEFLAAAIDRIEEGRSDSAVGALRTCNLLLDLLQGARVPLRRLGGLQ
jgi:hypothetical protein